MAKRIWATIIGALVCTLVSESTFSQDVQTTMLPRSTVAAFSILDGKAWQARWKTTGLAKFFENRAVKKYLNDVTSSASSEAAWLRLILPGDDPVAVAGQLTYALISTSNRYEHLLQIECDDAATAACGRRCVIAFDLQQVFISVGRGNQCIRQLTSYGHRIIPRQNQSQPCSFTRRAARHIVQVFFDRSVLKKFGQPSRFPASLPGFTVKN